MSFGKKYFFLVLFLAFGCLFQSYGQTFSIQQYTTEDGLTGSTAYSITQDKNQALWIATDGGVCKFNGFEFEALKEENLQGEVIKLYYDSKDHLWMIDLALQASYLDLNNDQLFRFEDLSQKYKIKDVFEDLNHNYWFTHPKGISAVLPSDSLDKMPLHHHFQEKSMVSLKCMIPVDSNRNILITRFGVDQFDNYQHSFYPFPQKFQADAFPHFAINNGDSVLIATTNRLFSFAKDDYSIRPAFSTLNHLFDAGINNIFLDADQNLWVATRDGVIYLKKQKDGSNKIFHFLKKYSIKNIFQDHESNYWIASQQEGLFKLSSNRIAVYKNKKYGDRVALVHSFSENEIIVGYNNNGMVVLDEALNETYEKKLSLSNEEIYDIKYDSIQNELYVVANFGIYKIKRESFDITTLSDRRGYKTCAINSNELWVGAFSTTSIFRKDQKNIRVLDKRTYAITFDQNNQAWIGTVEGLFSCKDQNCQKVPLPELYRDIRDLQIDKNGVLWIATQSNGVYLYKDGKIMSHITTQNGLSSNNCHRILLDNDFSWIATNNGISKINLLDFSIAIIRKDDGLPSNEINFLHEKKGKIYAATNKGLAVFDKNIEVYSTPPYLSFTNIQIKNRDTLILPKYDIPYNQNDIKIKFNGTTFKNAREVTYEYKIDPINQEWVSSNSNVVSFPALPFGEYNFLVRAKALNSDWSPIKKISFSIKKAFWQTWWFYGLIILIAFTIGGFFLRFIFRQIKTRNEIQQNLKASQLTALRAQMNPHFIFNALNSIQDFIIQEDKRSANRYLSKFSKLMRSVLDASDKNKITLKKEIEYLELYLSLEALRIDDEFEYNFDIDDAINVNEILIPSMLLQPYVENALKHGLMHRKGKKNLTIRFSQNCLSSKQDENNLFCEIEDNGIGREASMKINQQNGRVYQSKAMSLTQDRIDLLNSSDTSKLKLDIEDLKNADGSAAGTKVNICIFQSKNNHP